MQAKLRCLRVRILAGLAVMSSRDAVEIPVTSSLGSGGLSAVRPSGTLAPKRKGPEGRRNRRHERDVLRQVGDRASLRRAIIGPTSALSCWRGRAAREARSCTTVTICFSALLGGPFEFSWGAPTIGQQRIVRVAARPCFSACVRHRQRQLATLIGVPVRRQKAGLKTNRCYLPMPPRRYGRRS